MDAKEKQLFKERYDELDYNEMELEACYELIDSKNKWDNGPISPDELLDEIEEWVSYKGLKYADVCHSIEEDLDYSFWNEWFNDLEKFLKDNIEIFTDFVEQEYEDMEIDEALEDEEVIERFLNEAVRLKGYEVKDNVKDPQYHLSLALLDDYADDYEETENYLCIKNFQFTI
jgi:hypothetical protein